MKGHSVNQGVVRAEAIVTNQVFGFWGGIDTNTGIIIDEHHELCGQSIKGKVFVFPEGRGSTVGASVILELARCGTAPAAMVNQKTEVILATGAILAEKFYDISIPVVDSLDKDPVAEIKSGDLVEVNGDTGEVYILKDK
ncbi:MAG TPA: DUF126 domain-containing protein [Candidatus Pelethocola excrementipullorum]|nr:DUF126 domain-containing protein [Candidatus Pelethocola excrementipullorum]